MNDCCVQIPLLTTCLILLHVRIYCPVSTAPSNFSLSDLWRFTLHIHHIFYMVKNLRGSYTNPWTFFSVQHPSLWYPVTQIPANPGVTNYNLYLLNSSRLLYSISAPFSFTTEVWKVLPVKVLGSP